MLATLNPVIATAVKYFQEQGYNNTVVSVKDIAINARTTAVFGFKAIDYKFILGLTDMNGKTDYKEVYGIIHSHRNTAIYTNTEDGSYTVIQ